MSEAKDKSGEKNKLFKALLDYILLIIGGLLVGASVAFILLPVKLTTGGFSGIATILYYLFNIPADIGIVLLNVPVFLITWKVLGIKYGFRSLVGMMFCSIGINVFGNFELLTSDLILASIFGGIVSGLGIALTYRGGGSTGGTDLVAKLVHHIKPYMNLSEILLMVDGVVISILAFTFHDIEIALYSVVSVFVMTKVVDLILEGASYSKALFIITNKGDEISEYMHTVMNRTTTKVQAIGTYTNTEKEILLCVVNKKEVYKVKEGINSIDDKAFTIVTTVTEAIGEGFTSVS